MPCFSVVIGGSSSNDYIRIIMRKEKFGELELDHIMERLRC